MAGFNIYPRMSEAQVREAGAGAIEQITAWFQSNPDRDDAKVELWYGKVITFKRDTVAQQVNELVEQTVKEDNKARANAPSDSNDNECCGGCDK